MEPNEGNWKEVLKQQFVELKKQIEDIRLIKSKRDRKKDINEDINDCDMTEDDKSTVLEPSDSDDDSVSNKTYKSNKTKINIFISLRKKIQNLEEKFFDTEQNKMTNEKTFYLFGHLLIRTFDKMKIYLNNFDIYTKEYSENLENIRKVLIQKQNQFRRLFYTKMLTTYDNDMLEYETILQHRMDKLKLSHSREPTFVELKTNCLDIFKSYIVQCINLHWALKVNGICGNLDEFIEYLFEQKIHMNEQERKSIEQACAYFDIPLVNPQIICRKQIHIKAKQSENFIPSQHIDESIEQEEKIDINLIGLIRLIQNDRWTVLLGGAGTSKTTFARWLIFQFARALSVENKNILIDGVDMGPARLPILIRVGEFAQWLEDHPSSNLFNYIGYHTWYGQHYVIDECESLKDFVRYGHAFIILDGLDEVATIELHKRVVSLVRAFIQSYCMSHEFISPFDDALITKEELEYAFRCEGLFRGNIILITSRILNYSIHPLNGKLITHYTIQPMNTEYIRSFVENWCSYAQDEIIHLFNQHIPAFKQNNIKCQLKFKSKDLIKKIETNEKLRTLVSNSLVLSLVCTLFAQHGIDTFDKTRIQVYHKIVELMLQRWQYDRLNISKDALISIFSNIAFYIHSHSGSGLIDEFDLSHLCLLSLQQWYEKNSNGIKTYVRSKIQQQTKSFMQLLSEDAGIVAARALAVFSFLHLTFQEYFVCYALINDNNNSNDKQNIEVLVNKFLLLFPNPRLREPLNLVLGWISLHWSSENYDKFCIQLQSKTNLNNKRVPLGSLYFVSSLNDLVCLPSFRIVFDILNTLLDAFIYEDTSTGIFRCRLRLALYDLPVALVDNWFKDQFSKEDPMTTSKLIHIIYDEVSRDDILANWITPLVCQLLWKTIGLFNEETAVYIDRILLLIGAKDSDRLPVRSGSLREYLLSKSLPKRKIHSSILTAIVALYGGLERTYSQAKRQTLVTFTARCMHRDSSLSSLFIEYIKNTKEEPAIKLKHLTDQCEKILTTTNSTDIMLQKVHSLIVLFCVYSIDQSSIYEQYVGSEVWQQAVQHMKIVLLYLREFFPVSPISKFKRNLTDIFEYFMDDVQENILDFAQSVSHAYCRLLRTKTSCLYREFYMHHDHRSPFAIKMPKKTELPNVADWNDDLLIRLLPFICCVSPIRCPTSYIEEIEVEDFKLLKVERHSFQLLQNKPITLLLAYVPTSVQNLYVQMLAQNQISSENPFCLPLQHLLVEFLQIMSVMEIFSIRFWILFTVLLPIITQNRMENFILRFIDRTQLEDDRKQFVKVYKDNCFASYASKVRIGDYEEKHYILEPALIEEQQRLKHAQTDLELYAAACCSISLIDSLDESIEWKSWETELNQSWNAVQKIVQPLWRLDAMITIYRILFFARKDDETNDRIKHWYLSIITCFQELEREIPLSMVVALFIRCMTFMHKDCRVKKDLFNSILQRLETVTIDEQKAICQALLFFFFVTI